MRIETKIRTLLKTLSWRLTATFTTMVVAFAITKRVDIAVEIGLLEAILKLLVYYIHERIWTKADFGIQEKKPLVLWFTGLSGCGKSELSQAIYEDLLKRKIRAEYFNGRRIRDIFPEIGYSPKDRRDHIKKIGSLIKILEDNNTSVVGSFESPFEESRSYLRESLKTYIEIYIHASVDYCITNNNNKGLYDKAMSGELDNFVGVSIKYEEPKNPEIRIDIENQSIQESTKQVLKYLETNDYL